MNGILCAGDMYLERIADNGAGLGLIGPLNTTKLEIKPTSESKSRKSTKQASYGQLLDDVIIPGATEITIAIDDQPSEVVEMALQGEAEPINQGAGDLTAVAVTLLAGRWTELPNSNLVSLAASVTDSSNADAPLDIGADVEINWADGLIRPVVGGAIENGGPVKVTASFNALKGTRVKGGLASSNRYRLVLKGKNLANRKPIRLNVPLCTLSPSNGTDFMAADYVSTELTGKVILVSENAVPYSYEEHEVQP